MKTNIYKIAQIVLVLLILSTVAYAFYQSSLPPQDSAEKSDSAAEILEQIIPPETKPGEYVQKNIRKVAHFTEFFILGLWTSLYVVLFWKRHEAFTALLPFGMIVALLDETIQIFSGRGPLVTDVWIDVFGYSCAASAVVLTFLAVLLVKRILRNRKS